MANNNIQYTVSLKDINVASTLNNAEGAANRLEGALGGIKKGALLAVGAIAAMAAVAVKGIVEAGSSVETTRIALTNMLGSAKDAGDVISNTMKDAAATPFDFNNLLQANKMLIGAQVEASKAREDVLNLANAVAATGGSNDELNRMVGNLTQIKNVGQAAAVDIKQFAFANINIYKILADQMGITTEKLKKQLDDGLVITYEKITEALKKAHEAGGLYAGGLEALSDSTTVKMSAIGDALFQLKVRIFNDLKPAIDEAIERVFKLVEALGNMWEKIKIVFNIIKNSNEVKTLSAYFEAIGNLLMSIWESVKDPLMDLLNAIAEWRQPLMDLLTFLGTVFGFVLQIIGAILPPLIKITTWTIKFLKFIYDILDKLQFFSAMGKLLEIIAAIIDRVFKEIEAGYNMVLKPIIDALAKAYDYLVEILGLTEKINNVAPTPKDINEMLYGAKSGGADPNNPNQMVWAKNAPQKTIPSISKPSDLGKTTGTKSASSQKVINYNINISKLVEKFEVITTNIQNMGSGKVKELMTQALLSAVNDSQIVPER